MPQARFVSPWLGSVRMETTGIVRRQRAERVRDALERLVTERDVWVSMARPDHGPHQVPLWFLWDGRAVWMCTSASSVAARNVRKEPRVRLALPDTFDVVLLQGEAGCFPDQEVPGSAPEAHRKRSGGVRRQVRMGSTCGRGFLSVRMCGSEDCACPARGAGTPRESHHARRDVAGVTAVPRRRASLGSRSPAGVPGRASKAGPGRGMILIRYEATVLIAAINEWLCRTGPTTTRTPVLADRRWD